MKARTQAPVGSISTRALLWLVILLVPMLFGACDRKGRDQAAVGEGPSGRALKGDDAVISALVRAEETCLTLSGRMNALSEGLLKLRLPAPGSQSVFAPEVMVADLGELPTATNTLEVQRWPVATDSSKVTRVDLWRPLLDAVESFDHARVYVIDGEHPGGDPYRLRF
jgi:hypothetical protein